MPVPPSSDEGSSSPSKQKKKYELKIRKFSTPKENDQLDSPSKKSLNESYAASIERVVLNYSASEENSDDTALKNCSVSGSESGLSPKGKKTKNIPVKNKQSNGKPPKPKSPKRPKQVSAKKCKVRSTVGAVAKKLSFNQSHEGEGEADMPIIDSIFENSPVRVQKNSTGSSRKSGKKRKLFDADSFDVQENLESANDEQSVEKKARTLFPRRASNLRKQKFIVASFDSESLDKEKSPSKSILVKRNSPRSSKKLPRPNFREHEGERERVPEDPPKKKVKFESLIPNEILDLSQDHSIETLTELVRQKRIRPPYGQPYSVTGSWYIASGFLQDLVSLLEKFAAQEDSRFTSFASCWRQMFFSQIYRGRQSFKELLEFSEEAVVLTKKFLERVHSQKRRIGALYTLYSLYYKHPVRHNFFLRFTVSQYQELVALVKRQPHLTNPDPARILLRLHADCAIQLTAANNELCIGLHTAYNSSNVSVEYGFFRLAQSSNVPRALPDLAMDDKLVSEYHRVKTAAAAATPPAGENDETSATNTGPDRALSLFNTSCCDEAKQELLQLEDFTLTLLSFKGQHAVHARPPLHSDPFLALGVKRYAIKKRATSIAAAEAHAKLMERRQEEGESGESPLDEDLDLCVAQQLTKCSSKPTLYVGKLEIGTKEETLGGEGALENISPSKYGYKGPWLPAYGQSVVRRRRGRNPIYLDTRDRSLPVMPIEAAKISLNERNRQNRIMVKLAQRKDINLTLGVKGIEATQSEEPSIKESGQENEEPNMLRHEPSPEDEGFCSPAELENLGDTVGPEEDGFNIFETEDLNWSMGSRKEQSLLEMRLVMMVNGKREVKSVKARMSVARFETIKSDPFLLAKLHDKLLCMMLPKFRLTHGSYVVVKDLRIIKAQRCQPETVKPQDFITGNQPFVKSGKCNIQLRMRMMEKFHQKTPVQPKVEEIGEVTKARAKLIPIVVGEELKYIQCDVEDTSDSPVAVTSSDWQTTGVVRSHNCDWNKAKKITDEFKTYKYKLNAVTSNMRKIKPINAECPTKTHLKIRRYNKNEDDVQPSPSSRAPKAPYTLVSFRKSRGSRCDIRSAPKSWERNKDASTTSADEPDQPNEDYSQNDYQTALVKGRKKVKPKKKATSKASASSLTENQTIRRSKRSSRSAKLKNEDSTAKSRVSNRGSSSPKVKFSVARDAGDENEVNGSSGITYRARIPWHSTVVPDVDPTIESVPDVSISATENWRDSLLLSPGTVQSLADDHKEEFQKIVYRSGENQPGSESIVLTVREIQKEWENEVEHIDVKTLEAKPEDWAEGSYETFVSVGIKDAPVEMDSRAVESQDSLQLSDDEDSFIDPGTEYETIANEDHVASRAPTDTQLLDQLQENGVSVVALSGMTKNLNAQPADSAPEEDSDLPTPSNSDVNVTNSDVNITNSESTSFPAELPPLVSFNLPEATNGLPVYNSSSLPIILPPASLPGLLQPTSYYTPQVQSYIRAHTQDGAPVILPPNICFSIVNAEDPDMTGVNVRFSNSSEAVVFHSQPIVHSAVTANTIPLVTTDTNVVPYETHNQYGEYTQSVIAPTMTTDDLATSNNIGCSADVFCAGSGQMSQSPGLTTSLARLRHHQNVKSSLNLQPIPSVSSTESTLGFRHSPQTASLSPKVVGRSRSSMYASPTKIQSPAKETANHVGHGMSPSLNSPLKSCTIVSSAATSAVVASNTADATGRQTENVTKTLSSYMTASNNTDTLEKQREEASSNLPLDVSLSNTMNTSENNSLVYSPKPTEVTSVNRTNPIVGCPVTPLSTRKPTCSFLVANKFKKLGVAFGASGSASGKPVPVRKPRVSFFRKGALIKTSTPSRDHH